MDSLQQRDPKTAVIIGAGYIGLETAEGLTTRGIAVTQIEALPEVLPTVDPELGALVHDELERHGVQVLTNTTVSAVTRSDTGGLTVTAHRGGEALEQTVDFVLVVVGVRPDVELAADAGAQLGIKGAIAVDEAMRTKLPDVFAAGHPPPPPRTDVAAAGHYRPQAGPRRRGERPRGVSAVRRQPRHPGRQGLRLGGRPHRAA